jgi:hypothetical protein
MENLIGLSRTECECFELEDSESDSGLWLDELEGLNLKMIDAGTYCQELADFMKQARDNAIISLKADLLSALRNNYKPRHDAFVGLLGQLSYKKSITPTDEFVGVELASKMIKGSKIKIKRIGINIDTTKTVDVRFYLRGEEISVTEAESGEEDIAPVEIEAIANKWVYKTLDEPIILDLWVDGYNCLEYLVGYFPSGEKYKDNDTDCGCGSKSNYIENFIKFSGASGEVDDYRTSAKAHGLVLDVEMFCETEDIIEDNLIYSDFKLVLAHSLRYKAGFFLAQSILSSPNGNVYTNAVNPEQLYTNALGYESEYKNRVKSWLPENIKITNGCYVCAGARMAGILS